MNKFVEHIFVIAEDEANMQIANGFVNHRRIDTRRIQVVAHARGWFDVLTLFRDEYIPRLRRHARGHIVMLIDFDEKGEDRLNQFLQEVPEDLKSRVFVLGCSDEPEKLRAALGLPLETIGHRLADDCVQNQSGLWDDEQIRHNADQRQRLAAAVNSFLWT